MRRMPLALVLFLTALLLTACGGKDGGGGGSPQDILQGVNVVSQVSAIVLDSDTVILGDQLSVAGADVPSLTRYACAGRSCTQASAADGPLTAPLVRSISDLVAFTDPSVDPTGLPAHRGVELSRSSVNVTANGADWTFTNYGAWLDHTAFNTITGTATVEEVPWQTAYSVSFGNDTGTNPVGDGVWTGVMLGNTRHTGPDRPAIRPLRGDATITYDLAASTLDVDFSNVVYSDSDTNESFSDGMSWSGLDVSDGAFERRNDVLGHIDGRFYGPDHAEVGGVFTHPSAMGAFGAKK